MNHKTGILLVNVGSPSQPNVKAIRKYLKEFLSDPRVIDIHPLARWLLLNFFILPFRPNKTIESYKSIWTAEGSPLITLTERLARKLKSLVGSSVPCEISMRYGEPSMESKIKQLQTLGVNHIVVVPMYPQYAASSTGTVIAKLEDILSKLWNVPTTTIIPPFFDDPRFIKSQSFILKDVLNSHTFDHLLFSFHGLPERHLVKSQCQFFHECKHNGAACPAVERKNLYCYRAQSFRTAQLLAQDLSLQESQYSVSFQSRLGRTPWIHPYTDFHLEDLIKRGVKNLVVCCPSFVTDCLETLEEIGIRAKDQWKSLGGDNLLLAPCVNDHDLWAEGLADLIQTYLPTPKKHTDEHETVRKILPSLVSSPNLHQKV